MNTMIDQAKSWKEQKILQVQHALNEIHSFVQVIEHRIDTLNDRIIMLRSIESYVSARGLIKEKWRRACQLQSLQLTIEALMQAKMLLEMDKCRIDYLDPVNEITSRLQCSLMLLFEDNVSGRRG